uniref:uncharacterized protein LOC122584777 n=1 Tax=Erigeron canadensis TaxID=72917 RepID=UPI001CB89BC7|nr:uncharacterized protein LOC122584777 [Erigeron canadensis]
MTLKNFFTSTELKDGITSPERVKDLVTVMQKEKECVENDVGPAARVWSTVADVIAVSESKDCLDLFVELDGVGVINKWLDGFREFGNDSGNVIVGESVIALLRVLEKLQIDKHRLVASGVRETVMNFVGHGNSAVYVKAKDLCDKWVQIQDTELALGHEETKDGMKQVENEEVMDPATTNNQEPSGPVSSPGANDVVESAMKTDVRENEYMMNVSDGALQDATRPKVDSGTESGSEGNDVNKHVGGQSEDGLGTEDGVVSEGSDVDMEAERELDSIEQSCATSEKLSGCGTERPKSPDSNNEKESETVEGSDHKHDISVSQVSEAPQKSKRDFLGVDLNDEICFENFSECSVSGACSVSKHQSSCLNIDLNAADGSEDKNVIISGLPSGEESNVDAGPRRSMKLDLDLNSLGDGSFVNVIPDWKLDGRAAHLNQNRCQSPSQSSSSSSMQPYTKKIDLNLIGQANFPNVTSLDHQNGFFSLFGTQLEVNHHGLGSSMGVYGHTHSQPGPCMRFSPDKLLGEPTSYVVDPKLGLQVSHQYIGSSDQVPPLITNFVAGPSSDPTDTVPLQLNLGLSSSFMVHGGNSGGSPVITGKRKEPDCGWDGLQVNYIHKQAPWI